MKKKKFFTGNQLLILLLTIIAIVAIILSVSRHHFPSIKSPILYTEKDKTPIKNTDRNISTKFSGRNKHIVTHMPLTDDNLIDAQIESFIDARIKIFEQYPAFSGNSLCIDYEAIYQSDKHISFIFRERFTTQSLKQQEELFCMNFNVKKSTLMTLDSLFKDKDDTLDKIYQYISKQISNNHIPGVTIFNSKVFQGIRPVAKNYNNFSLDKKGIYFYFTDKQLDIDYVHQLKIFVPNRVIEESGGYKDRPDGKTIATAHHLWTILPPSIDPNQLKTKIIPRNKKKVSLLFENGPHSLYTPLLLDILEKNKAVATFFPLGIRANEFPEIISMIIQSSHSLGSGSWSHPCLANLSELEAINDFDQTKALLERLGYKTKYYLPPYAPLPPKLRKSYPLHVIDPTIDASKIEQSDPNLIISYIVSHARNGSIILLDELNENTVQLLNDLIIQLRKAGFECTDLDNIILF